MPTPAIRAASAPSARTISRTHRTRSDRQSITPRARQGIPAPARRTPRLHNRLRVLLAHVPRYTIRGQARLARDCGVARSTISRLARGRSNPSHALAQRVTDALARHLGRPLDARDVFSADGGYPTPSGCALCGCHGCLPAEAWDADDVLRPEWRDQRPGDWSFARPLAQEEEMAEIGDARGDGDMSEVVPQGKELAGKEAA